MTTRSKETGASAFLVSECPLTKIPGWLRWDNIFGKFQTSDDNLKILYEIVGQALNGVGPVAIATHLNTAKIPTFSTIKKESRGKFWSPATINSILRSPALKGCYQPITTHVDENHRKKRLKAGKVIEGFFPEILDPETWDTLQSVLNQRSKNHGRGNKKNVSNLFGNLLTYGPDKSPVVLTSNQHKHKIMSSRLMRLGITRTISFPYEVFEFVLLKRMAEIKIIGPDKAKEDVKNSTSIRFKLDEIESKLAELKEKIKNSKSVSVFLDMIDELATERDELDKSLADEMAKERVANTILQNKAELDSFISRLTNATLEDLQSLRSGIRLKISQLVRSIRVWFAGNSCNRRCCVCQVVLNDSSVHLFSIRKRRGRNPETEPLDQDLSHKVVSSEEWIREMEFETWVEKLNTKEELPELIPLEDWIAK